MADYANVSIPIDLWERVKRAHKSGKFQGRGYRSASDAVTDATRRLLVEIGASA